MSLYIDDVVGVIKYDDYICHVVAGGVVNIYYIATMLLLMLLCMILFC